MIPRTDIERLKSEMSSQEIAEELDVEYIVEGSVNIVEPDFRVTASLINPFIENTLNTMRVLVKLRGNRQYLIGVDGGVNISTIAAVFATNIDIAIVGSGIFEAQDIILRYKELLSA